MNKDFLFATSSQKIKRHVLESQITLLVAEINRTINHMIIFNDSVSKVYQYSIWGFCQAISMVFSICLVKNNAELIKFLGILKKYVSKNIFSQERKQFFA